MRTIKVDVQNDHITKLASISPERAMAEIVWNSLDAEATTVRISFEKSELKTDSILIRDNGHAFKAQESTSLFGLLGGSWKFNTRKTPNLHRFIHGKEGQGRFRAFSLGSLVEWISVFEENGKKQTFTITGSKEDIKNFQITEIKEVGSTTPIGVTVKISNLYKELKIFNEAAAVEKITPLFALYLESYPDVNIWVENRRLDSTTVIGRHKTISLDEIQYEGQQFKHELEIIEWKEINQSSVYYSDADGFPFEQYDKQVRGIGDYSYSAYLKSAFYRIMYDSGLIFLPDNVEEFKLAIKKAIQHIKDYFLARSIENSKNQIEEWKANNIYPYKDEAVDAIEQAERQVFDILAINVNKHLPEFGETDNRVKAFQFRMLRQAVEKNPQELQTILEEVLQLPKDKQIELAELLEETSLSAIISASRIVTDRLKFLQGFEEIIFDTNLKKLLKERSQLHRILADNIWVFGDAFSLSVDDQSLTEVLVKHRSELHDEIEIDKPVHRIDSTTGIIDLMLSKSVPCNHANEREHLIIELKAPRVSIGQKEIGQINSYAIAVADDERFRSLNTRWEFWVISNDYDKYAKMQLTQQNYADGVIFKTDPNAGINITIRIKTWSELLQECKHRLQFIKQQLNYNIDRNAGLDYLKKKYAKYTQDVLVAQENEITISDEGVKIADSLIKVESEK
jgi:hypothetical protein